MTVIDHPSPNHSPRNPSVRVDTIVLHHTGGASDSGAISWLCNPVSQASAHYVVSATGVVHRLVPEHRKAWHAGVSCLPWQRLRPEASVNGRSIGIELVNPGDGRTPFTEAQYLALGWLLPGIAQRHGMRSIVFCDGWGARVGDKTMRAPFPADASDVGIILGHRDIAPGRKTDPADNFDWARVRQALAGGGA